MDRSAQPTPRLMRFDQTFSSPAENLACDEALLDQCEISDHPGFIRFWESPTHFVVLGYGKDLEKDVFREECARLRIPVLRRCSGGGTVLQGPGCLNYTLVLPVESAPELETISGANCFIMQRIRKAVALLTNDTIEIRGFTDLVVNGRKFSGNAQRRKRRCLLFHGAFLLDFNLDLITGTLRLPAQQPEYRAQRVHRDFVTNLPVDRARLQSTMQREWNASTAADTSLRDALHAQTQALASTKYNSKEWTERS